MHKPTDWSDLVESSLRQANTTASASESTSTLRLRAEPQAHWLPRKPRRICEIAPGLRDWIAAVAGGKSPWPLFVSGPAGCGKTCAALCLLDHAGGFYYTVSGLCRLLIQAQQGQAAFPGGRILHPENLWDEIVGTSLMVLDEIGARERVSDFHYETVQRVLDDREGRPLVCLSNLRGDALARIYDDRIVSRLFAGTTVAAGGRDRRLQKRPSNASQ